MPRELSGLFPVRRVNRANSAPLIDGLCYRFFKSYFTTYVRPKCAYPLQTRPCNSYSPFCLPSFVVYPPRVLNLDFSYTPHPNIDSYRFANKSSRRALLLYYDRYCTLPSYRRRNYFTRYSQQSLIKVRKLLLSYIRIEPYNYGSSTIYRNFFVNFQKRTSNVYVCVYIYTRRKQKQTTIFVFDGMVYNNFRFVFTLRMVAYCTG